MTPVTTEFSLSQDTSFHVRYASPQGPERILDTVHNLRGFLSLGVGVPVTVLKVVGLRDDFTIRPDSKARQPVEILAELPHNPEPPERPRHPHEMFFTRDQVSPNVSEALRAWFARQDKLAPVFNL